MEFLEIFLHGTVQVLKEAKTFNEIYTVIIIFVSIGLFVFGLRTYQALRLYLKYRDISKDIRQIGKALLNSMSKVGVVSTDISTLKVVASVDDIGAVSCCLEGGTTFENSAFINALCEIISPVDNPRYVIIRKSKFIFFINQKDYHSVPEILGRNKNTAEYFKRQWVRFVGACDLIYARTIEGRKTILKSRAKSLAAQFDENDVERVNKWR